MYIFNERVLLRVEYKGGVVINKDNFARIELDKQETYFLFMIKATGDIDFARKMVIELFGEYNINIEKLENLNIIKNVMNKNNNIISEKVVGDIKQRCTEVWENNENYLSAPLELTLYPTLKCNLNCKFCFVKNKNNYCKEIGAKKWLKVIKEGKELGLLSVSILGGEPTLYSEIDALLEGIEKLDIKATITTNGVYLKNTTKDIIIKCNNIIPVFSLQALNEKHKLLTGIDYKIVINTIESLLQSGKKVRINSVYTEQSLEDFYQIIDFCIDHGIERYSIAAYVSTNEDNDIKSVKNFKEVRELDEQLQEYISGKYGENRISCSIEGCMTFSAYPELENDIYQLSNFEKNYYGCRAGKSKIEIYNNGDVYPCICFENIFESTSNILNNSLLYIWNNDYQMNELRNNKCKNKECNNCGFYDFCNGGCPAYKRQIYKEDYLNYKDPTCIMHKE